MKIDPPPGAFGGGSIFLPGAHGRQREKAANLESEYASLPRGGDVMDASEVRNRIKKIIGSIAGMDPQRIGDEATLRGELSLDSLSLLEIGVDVDLAFQLNLPDESYKDIDSLPAM